MPYPIDATLFDPAWIAERAERARSSPNGPVRVLFMGGDFPRKGGVELLTAWREGGFERQARLDVVIDWPLRAADVPPGVHLSRGITPYSPRWFDLWRRADLFVMPTRGEAFGMVYQEAAAAGLPCIATNITAIPEIVQDGRTGLLIRPGDVDGLVCAMRALAESPDRRCQMGTAARGRIATAADPKAYATKLGELVQTLAGMHAHQPT